VNFCINKALFEAELSRIQALLTRKVGILENVLLACSEGSSKLYLSATNGETTLFSRVETEKIDEYGSLCLPARRLYSLLHLLQEGSVQVKTENHYSARVIKERSRNLIPGINPSTFPNLPELPKSYAATLSAELLRNMLKRVGYAVATEGDTHFATQGILFKLDQSASKMVALDGQRLSIVTGSPEEFSLIDLEMLLSQRTLEDLQRLLSGLTEDEVQVSANEQTVCFEFESRTLLSRQLLGRFPDYQLMIDQFLPDLVEVILPHSELTLTLKRTMLTSEGKWAAALFEFCDDSLQINVRGSSVGESLETLTVENAAGMPRELNINIRFLLDFLERVTTEQVLFAAKNGPYPVRLCEQNKMLTHECFIMPTLTTAASNEK
jgi:DNA polymerase-3 subunit beta